MESDAIAIMAEVEADKANEPMRGRWGDVAEDCLVSMRDVLAMGIKSTAAKWLAANKPMHWARPMFDEEIAKELGLSA